jgi:hypothetical protein
MIPTLRLLTFTVDPPLGIVGKGCLIERGWIFVVLNIDLAETLNLGVIKV